MKYRGLVLCLALLWCIVLGGYGQIIRNASFEGPPTRNFPPSDWTNCGVESTADTPPNVWGINQKAFQGLSYVRMIAREDGSKEMITQVLSTPLERDSMYYFVIYLAQITSNETSGPGRLNVWGGEDSCGRNQLLWQSPEIAHVDWEPYLVAFETNATYKSLSFEAEFVDTLNYSELSIGLDYITNFTLRDTTNLLSILDTAFCGDGSYFVDLTYLGAKIIWQDSIEKPFQSFTESGTYHVAAVWENVTLRDTFEVSFDPVPELELGNDTLLCLGETLVLDAEQGGGFYEWQDGSSEPQIEVAETGNYVVDYSSANAKCFASDSIYVEFEDCEHFLEMPNVFSPNDDGINDVFKPMQMKGIREVEWYIIDRWGRRVYEAKELDTVWDGSLNGSPLPEGTYYWILAYREPRGARVERNGYVVLVR